MGEKKSIAENRIEGGAHELEAEFGPAPKFAIILGTGMNGAFEGVLTEEKKLPYAYFDHFPKLTVEGHKGEISVGYLGKKKVCIMAGRKHGYEGSTIEEIVRPVRILAQWGVEVFFMTNAAGALNTDYSVGDLMIIKDHLTLLMPANPLTGPNNDKLGVRFPSQEEVYDAKLIDLAKEIWHTDIPGYLAKYKNDTAVQKLTRIYERKANFLWYGTYVAVPGPQFETPADVRLLKAFADAVGMSTVPDALALTHMKTKRPKIRLFATSVISNIAEGLSKKKINHKEVKQEVEKVAPLLRLLLKLMIQKIK